MRRNRSQTAKRRSHHGIAAVRTTRCECGAAHVPHRACPECGRYKGRVVIDVVAAKKRDARRAKRREKDMMAAGKSEKKSEEKETAAKQ